VGDDSNTETLDASAVEALLRTSAVFSHLDDESRAALIEALDPRFVRRGDIVMLQGDPADGMYLVASGRLQVILESDNGDTPSIISEVGPGHVVGEMALLTDGPRTATVVARRDSHILFMSSDAFARVVGNHPGALRGVASALVDKLLVTMRRGDAAPPATVVAVVALDDSTVTHRFADDLASALTRVTGSATVLRETDQRVALGPDATALARSGWRDANAVGTSVVYTAGPYYDQWTDEALQQADVVVLVADALGSSALRPIEKELVERSSTLGQRVELVLLHPSSTPHPHNTRRWFETRHVERHHNVRVGRADDHERVARLLCGQGIGIVFSGGGARGIAHVGVYRALLERNIPVDATAGASIGSIVAGALARGDSAEELALQMRAAVVERSPVDLTFPTVSFASGARVTNQIRDAAQGLDIEDCWSSFRCVSTNLTTGGLEVHDRGPGWAAIRASFAVPGLFPPMRNELGHTLVDGGLLDNMPVSTLRRGHSGLTVISVDVGARREFSTPQLPDTGVVSGWRSLATSLRQRRLQELTSLPRILLRLTELNTLGDDDRGELCIRPPLEGVSLLDFDRFDELVELGVNEARVALDEWLASPAGAGVARWCAPARRTPAAAR
jgi:predicted acylesterase/phospholipase RssA/CRP-like cAMP-binding protein